MLSKKNKVGVALAAAVAFSGAGVEAYRGESLVNGTTSFVRSGVAMADSVTDVKYVRGVKDAAKWTGGKITQGGSAAGAWFNYYLHLPGSGAYDKSPTTRLGKVRSAVADVFAPVTNGLGKAGKLVTDNPVARAMHNAYDASLEGLGKHQTGIKRAGVVVAAGAAVYGVYYLVSEMQEAERSIALSDLEARLSAGDLQDATLATLVETRGIKEKEYGAANKRLARRQRAEHRDYTTREESDLLETLEGQLAEIDEALVVAYQADAGYWTRALNIVSHAVAGE